MLRHTTLIKKFPEFIQKIQNKFYSSKVILSPSKYSPSTATHLYQRLIQFSKYFWNSSVGHHIYYYSSNTTGSALTLLRINSNTTAVTLVVFLYF